MYSMHFLDGLVERINSIIHKKCREKIDLLNSEIQEQYKQIDRLYRTTKNLEHKIEIIEYGDDSKPPTWLDPEKGNYPASIHVAERDRSYTVQIPPKEIYVPSASLQELVEQKKWRGLPLNQKFLSIWRHVITHIKYRYDWLEGWEFPVTTHYRKRGDCFAGYEEIYTENGLKKIKDIKAGDNVLSYDFKEKSFVKKRVVDIWYKGELEINRVHFRNGTWMDVSEKHPMWVRTNQKKSEYDKVYLNEIDLKRWWKRKVPIVKHLPREINDREDINEDVAFLIGYFLAEGCLHKDGRVELSGYEITENIIPILEKNNIEFSERVNNSGVPIVYVHGEIKNIFKQFTRGDDTLSFSAKIPEWVFSLPDNKLKRIMDGYFLGDGTKNVGKNQYNKEYVLSTSSYELAMDLQRIALHLGYSFHIYKQNKHGGVGNRPIYRLTKNPESYFLKDYGYNGLSEVSISYIEKLGKTKMYDLTVEDTSTIILRNGIVTHQCEDGTTYFVTLCRIAGVPANRVFNAVGKMGNIGHSFPIVKMEDDKWYIMETTIDFVPKHPMLFRGSKYRAVYGVYNWKFSGGIANAEKQV